MELNWIGSSSASALHLADEVIRGRRLTDVRLAPVVAAASELREELSSVGDAWDLLWSHMLGLCATVENNRLLVQTAAKKAWGQMDGTLESRVVGAVGRLEDRLRETIPGLADQLVQRLQPLFTQWRARGPGIVHQVSKMVEPGILVPQALVVGVLPVTGGAARPLLHYNLVHMEAVLADVDDQLPEVLRLAWAVLQLNVDIPKYSEMIHRDRLSLVAGLALVPITLAVGEYVELTRLDEATLNRAINSWCDGLGAGDDAAAVVLDWWGTFLEDRPSWSVAVTALDRMLT